MKQLTLRTHLTLFYTAILALLLLALGFVYYHALALQLNARLDDELTDLTTGLRGYLRFEAGAPVLDYDRDDPDQVEFVDKATRYYQVYALDSGRLLARSSALEQIGLQFTPQELQALRRRSRTFDLQTDQTTIRFSNSVITVSARDAYLLQVGIALQPMDDALYSLLRLQLWSIPVGLLVVALAGRWMAGKALQPLGQLAEDTRHIGIANLDRRLPIRGAGDELDEVAHGINATLAHLEHAVGDMRQFTAAIAHELRTPLTALRGEAEVALMRARSDEDYRRVLVNQLEEFDRLSRIINQLLTLARAQSGQIALAREPVDLAALGASIVEQLDPLARSQEVQLECLGDDSVTVVGDRAWLERLLINLLDNALKFTPPGGRVSLIVTRERRHACLEVRDTGIGIPDAAIPHVFERFFRADPARSRDTEGAGLGLALVKWIAEQHGATVEVQSRPGQGTRFTLRLSASDISAAPAAVTPASNAVANSVD
jgi:heavy metal sensor kinase